MDIQHSIQSAAKLAGVTAHVIRAWEKRYNAVSPDRTDTNRRLYSGDEIERLRLLGVLTRQGHRIGDIARQPTPALANLVAGLRQDAASRSDLTVDFLMEPALQDALAFIGRMDPAGLDGILRQGAVALGQRGVLGKLISPLARRLGERWADGTLSAAHEHFASSILREFLSRASPSYAESVHAPMLLVATPAGQLHELGAAMVAAYARDLGWRVRYLGPSLPAADIAHAAVAHSAHVVALSIVHPADDPGLPGELKYLRQLLPAKTTLIAGGQAALAYAKIMDTTGIVVTNTLDDLSACLTRDRETASTTAGDPGSSGASGAG